MHLRGTLDNLYKAKVNCTYGVALACSLVESPPNWCAQVRLAAFAQTTPLISTCAGKLRADWSRQGTPGVPADTGVFPVILQREAVVWLSVVHVQCFCEVWL
ncbi:unnamed protein product [Arctia plantaginis]|uniref:Uncharacterized protein n=1 Tax=Arctia plantaginis TaxID=874455 RepID=A0A8S0ZXX6_ARCPL|nr:unnamed protein product [Arctia plantaginis]